jgi:outer membrane immunogenic protein
MKKILMACAAVAALALPGVGHTADLAVKAPPAPPAAPNWTGCYVGLHAGAGWGDKWWSDRNVTDNVTYPTSGWLAGAQFGCDYQSGPLVIGAEASWSWTNAEGNGALVNVPAAQLHSKLTSLTTAGGRVGLVADKALIFVKVAAAWASEEHTFTPAPAAVLPPQTLTDTRVGALLGAGIDYMIAPVLTARIEYDYIDFGTKNFLFNAIPGQVEVGNRQRLHLMKLGDSYKFM